MKQEKNLSADELKKRLQGIRSLSGCFRLVAMIQKQHIDVLQSHEKIALFTQLLEKITELSGVAPEAIRGPVNGETRVIVHNYTHLLLERTGLRNAIGEELSEANADARAAIRYSQLLGDTRMEGLALNHLGNNLMSTQHIREAQQCFRASTKLDRQNGCTEELARSLYNLARAELSLSLYNEAIETVNEGIALYEENPELFPYGQAFFLSVRQDIYESQDDQGKALADGLRSLEIFQQLGMTERLASAHYHVVRRYVMLDQPTEAMQHAMLLAEIADQTQTQVDKIFANLALAAVYIRFEELDVAMRYARSGLELARTTKLLRMAVLCLERIARILRLQGEQRLALSYLYEALEIEDRPKAKADLHRIIAAVWLELGDNVEARREIQERQKLPLHQSDPRIDGELLLVCAAIAAKEKEFDEAIEILTTITNRESVRPTFRRDAHEALSNIYKEIGNFEKAIEHYEQFHALSIELEQRLAGHRLTVFRAQHEVESHRIEAVKAQELQQKILLEKEQLALEVSERQHMIEHTRSEIGNALRSLERNKGAEAKEILQEILRLLHKAPIAEEQWLHHLPNIDNDFFARLRERYPTLTKGQIRLCGLLRSGLTSSDIAQRLHVSIETVTTQRKRLRKRMNLKEGENLENLLAEM